MQRLVKIIEYIRWPIVTGAIGALILLMMFPNLMPHQTRPDSGFDIYSSLVPQEGDWQGPVSYSAAVQRAGPAVVNIYTSKINQNPLLQDPFALRHFKSFNQPSQERMPTGLGSGVIVSTEGYLLTNHHIIKGADEIVIALQDGRDATAEIVGTNTENDLVVLKIELNNLTAIPIGSPERIRVGDVVLAIGNPFGMGQTVTQGIVSATRRGLRVSESVEFIQTDAAINPGNSGGALIDAQGNLLGINTARFSQNNSGFGFAVPVDSALRTLNDIVQYGRVLKGWLGIDVTTGRMGETQGLLITGIVRESPADQAGLRQQDVITHINDRAVGGGNLGRREIQQSRPGEKISIDVIRNTGKEATTSKHRIEATVGISPEDLLARPK